MGQTNLLIPQVKVETRSWTSRVTIIEHIPIMTCGNGKKLKRYVLTDDEGNEIAATVFLEHVRFITPVIHLFNVYDITNAQVRFVPSQYRIINNQYHWVLQRDTLIRPVLDHNPNLRYFFDNLTPYSMVVKKSVGDINNIDIVGAIIDFEEPTIVNTVNGLKNIQRFTFIDIEKIPLTVTLSEEMPKIVGPILEEAANKMSIVVVKRLSFASYKGKCI
ncbi:hypothetical protein LIER_40906 [Lithospermum erythrorhizon]|uniref:Replication protein A 70 kDa DNA-binding subunit B/D first OB fold domain-containing protein n=1 Tax=Lithospermum erythrorhizon TaxID=34254 RepID=A0AAV3R2S7_LITER